MVSATPTVQIDNERVKVTRWDFAPGAETGEHVHAMDYIVVPATTGALTIVDAQGQSTVVSLEAGVSYSRKAGVHHNVINSNDNPFTFIEIELKD